MNDRPPVISQLDVDALLVRLQESLREIDTARLAVAPLEAGLTMAYNDYQAIVGRIYRETNRLQMEIDVIRARIDGVGQDAPSTQGTSDESKVMGSQKDAADPEAVEKDVLLEHLFRVLDPMVNDADAENNPTMQLVDALEKIPWGIVWTTRGPQEDLMAQNRRLSVWEQALARQLNHLKREEERLRKDSRYGLWEQYQKGPAAWQQFLQHTAQQQQEYNVELNEKLRSLQDEWLRIVDNA
jgi:hypothetical protein